jgi:copper chaperone CopZ
MNTLRLADEVNAVRARVKELEDDNKYQADVIGKLIDQNVQDQRSINEINRAYTAHLESHGR